MRGHGRRRKTLRRPHLLPSRPTSDHETRARQTQTLLAEALNVPRTDSVQWNAPNIRTVFRSVDHDHEWASRHPGTDSPHKFAA